MIEAVLGALILFVGILTGFGLAMAAKKDQAPAQTHYIDTSGWSKTINEHRSEAGLAVFDPVTGLRTDPPPTDKI